MSAMAERYLDLMRRVLDGTCIEDPPMRWGAAYDSGVRSRGLDWPATALTMVGSQRLANIRHALEQVLDDNIPGDFVETGVWRGGASIFARAVLLAHGATDRNIICCDSFEGLPPPDAAQYPADRDALFHTYPELSVSLDEVKANFASFDLLDAQVVFLKGWFRETMKQVPSRSIAVLRLDGDLYESTIDPLRHLYDRIPDGGYVIVDDYELIASARQAVHDFLDLRHETQNFHAIDGVGVFFRKNETAFLSSRGKIRDGRMPKSLHAKPNQKDTAMPSQDLRFSDLLWRGDDRMSVGGLSFDMSVTDFTHKTSATDVVLLKNRAMLEAYRDLLDGRPVHNILEFGTWEGGSPLFFAAATNARRIVGIDIRDRADAIDAHAAAFGDRLKLVYKVSQADDVAVHRVIDESFEGALDLVIDDASHEYALTKKAFEIGFSRLKVGGTYIIEDWNWAHYEDRQYDDRWQDQPALSNLALELAMAVGSHSPIASMEVLQWCLIVTKGAEIARDFKLDDLIRLGRRRSFKRI